MGRAVCARCSAPRRVRRSTLAVDDGELGAARRSAGPTPPCAPPGSGSRRRSTVPPPPAPPPDLRRVAATLATGAPAAVLLLTSPAGDQRHRAAARAARVHRHRAPPTRRCTSRRRPRSASGLTVLVPYAPFEQSTAANRRLAADVEAFAAGTQLTPGIAAGLLVGRPVPADAGEAGKPLTRERFLAVAPGGSRTRCPAPSAVRRWPAMHAQGVPCGALVQSDGTRYFVAEPYRCGKPIVVKRRSATTPTTTGASDARAQSPSSRRNPTFIVTWNHAMSPSFIAPRMSVTSNQSRLRSVFDARGRCRCGSRRRCRRATIRRSP